MLASEGNPVCSVWQVKKGFHSSAVPADAWEMSSATKQKLRWSLLFFPRADMLSHGAFLEVRFFCRAPATLSASSEAEIKAECRDLVYWSPASVISLETI